MSQFHNIFQTTENDFNSLDQYLQEYFSRILQKMKELNETQNNATFIDSF